MLSVITALEFFQHYFSEMGHRNTSCDPHLHQVIEQPTLHYLTRSVRRRAATSKRACIDWIRRLGAARRKVGNPQDAPSFTLVMGVHRHGKPLKILVAQ